MMSCIRLGELVADVQHGAMASTTPPVETFTGSELVAARYGSGVTLSSKACFNCIMEALGWAAASRAMMPVTIGVAMEVPDK